MAVGDIETAIDDVFFRLAFITRYSSASLTEAEDMDVDYAARFMGQLAKLIREENSPRKA